MLRVEMLRPRSVLVAVIVVVVAAMTLAVSLGTSASLAPKITAVTFHGPERNPVITIHGLRLGARPKPNPVYQPLGHPPLCPTQPTKPLATYGLDFGSGGLFVDDRSQTPAWAAGRYRPQLQELDCIGLVVISFSPTKVVFRLGAAYREPTSDRATRRYDLAEGDTVIVGVNGVRFTGRVHYS
jgi:hypothetical protein